ncbi:lung seven transmembrane receptor-domain-containing protein [Rhodocollybia butyracea]|uniref:Lung seven transmembrane receptor-domain-containing protein n=1 Tax=Rhodocollybia butyracea TaxID=206335 RepID=A0A9P5Q7G5_9AGAR|nr:lung seven transmembrane receptor-domain-containing protein [Rhodocollybia butyracea]
MWANQQTYINVSFDATSQGQVAMVVYEWADAPYLGITTDTNELLPSQKTYVCTSSVASKGFCTPDGLGRFILDLPSGKSINDTSFWSARVELPANNSTTSQRESTAIGDVLNPSPNGIYKYTQPIQYLVRKTGYYCVAIVPVTVQGVTVQDVPSHPAYNALVFFRNKFDGRLPATDYPKVNFYFVMFIYWGWLCYKNAQDLLPLQYYLSGLVGLLVIEMVANWGYYRYLNAHGRGTTATVFLIVVAILDAGRNSMSFFMLLVVSLGLSVVKESLGRTMIKCQALAAAHFIFGILYAVGIVELELESTSALVLLLFVIPLAFTLSGFLLWIMYSLNATITQLRARKQRYKLSMFEKLYRILLFTVLVIAIFFVVSSFSFSGRLAEDYAAKSWKVQWWLLDGWLALLYLVCFVAIAYLWRPSENNRRYVHLLLSGFLSYLLISTLAMSEELAQDEADAEDYDLESFDRRGRDRDDDDEVTLRGDEHNLPVGEDSVVFEIGDEDEEDMTPITAKSSAPSRYRTERHSGEERRGLIGGRGDDS